MDIRGNCQKLLRDADTILNLQYIVNGTAQPIEVYAIDGYSLSSGSAVGMTTIQLGPGARAEFVVTTPSVGDTAQLVTQYQNTGPDGDFEDVRPIANVVSQTGAPAPAKMPSIGGSVSTTLNNSLANLTPTAHRNLYFSEVLQNPADPNSPTNFYITEEGQTPALFTMGQSPNIVVHAGTVEDWTVENRAGEDHVFHIHQLHFQVIAVDGVAVNDPALRDTYDIPYWSGTGAYHSITVRMDFSDPNIVGTFVYHCHILEHEDGGMMGEIQDGPQRRPVGAPPIDRPLRDPPVPALPTLRAPVCRQAPAILRGERTSPSHPEVGDLFNPAGIDWRTREADAHDTKRILG